MQDKENAQKSSKQGIELKGVPMIPGTDHMKAKDIAIFMRENEINIMSTMPSTVHTMAALLDDATKLETLIGKEVEIANLIYKYHEFDHEDGSKKPGVEIVMVDASGGLVRAAANGVLHSLNEVCKFIGKPPWNPAWRFKVSQRPVPIPGTDPVKMGRTFKLVPIIDEKNVGTEINVEASDQDFDPVTGEKIS
jgi:hypothetical protein